MTTIDNLPRNIPGHYSFTRYLHELYMTTLGSRDVKSYSLS